ncbi:hypothetical protein HOLleu_01277 [Holothuria leucospilota]|uniref:Immunoglobulin domain-containing protein n=1 Tax=Holothuria leucospilota TaxID=206669 RepID=A0A9Q1HJ52_HOLLE|nr:hypothetical protein HOLleu_01277 [Holothuria leucospilota]
MWSAITILTHFLAFTMSTRGNNDCISPQFLKSGETGIVQCSFNKNFYGLVWYNSVSEAVITVEESAKSGDGFESNEFNVLANGSLVITNVTKQHEGTFTVLLLETRRSEPIRHVVNIFVVAKDFKRMPIINHCNASNDICFKMLSEETEVSCVIRDSPFIVPLTMVVRTADGDHDILTAFVVTNNSKSSYTTRVSTSDRLVYSSLLTLLVCKGENSNGLLTKNESFILIQNDNETLSLKDPVKIYSEISSRLELSCTDSRMLYLVWQRKKPQERVSRNVVLATFDEGFIQKNEKFKFQNDGSLVVEEIGVEHEGLYQCISGDGLEVNAILYDVVLVVPPIPLYPAVEGCNIHQGYCVLELHQEDSLMCSIRRIRPQVELKFKLFHEKSSQTVHFFDIQLIIKENENAFDIMLNSKFRVIDDTTRLTMECQVVGTNIKQFKVSTKFDILLSPTMDIATSTEGKAKESDEFSRDRQITWIISVFLAVILFFACCILLRYVVKACQTRGNRRLPSDTYRRVRGDMIPMEDENAQKSTKDEFISQLKEKYENLYNDVKPIPYIRDKLLRIDKVFVEGGIQYLAEKKK